MRILALDPGTQRVGVAISDPTGTIAQSLTVIPQRSWAQTLGTVRRLAAEYHVDRIVVGLPLRLDGSEGDAARAARAFADRLRRTVDVPVVLQDERLSTAEAERTMITAEARRLVRRKRRDAVAAALILQRYLDEAARARAGEDSGQEGGS